MNAETVLVAAMAFSALIGATAGTVASALVLGASSAGDRFVAGISSSGRAFLTAGSVTAEEEATLAAVDAVQRAVVSISVKRPRRDAPDQFVDVGGGTGFFVTPRGHIVTNRHVISDPLAVYTVLTDDGAELPVEILATDPFLDIAILQVEGDGYPTAVLGDSEGVRIGQTVLAVGNTLSSFHNTVTKGIVSGLDRRVTGSRLAGDIIEQAIQTDAAINPGNSGGPLVNLLGEVIGVNTAISFDGQSVGFAIPINEIKRAVTDVEQYGRIVRPWMGVRYVMLDPELARAEGLSVTHGALVGTTQPGAPSAVTPDSPAAAAGLRDGDIITAVNGQTLGDGRSLGRAISVFAPGDVVTLSVARGEEEIELHVTLGEFPAE